MDGLICTVNIFTCVDYLYKVSPIILTHTEDSAAPIVPYAGIYLSGIGTLAFSISGAGLRGISTLRVHCRIDSHQFGHHTPYQYRNPFGE